MSNTVEVAKKDQLKNGSMIDVTADGKKIILAQVDGKYYAVDSICTHMEGRLSWGVLEGTSIQCPKHQLIYDITNGKVIKPGKCGAGASTVSPLKTYPVIVEGETLKIEI